MSEHPIIYTQGVNGMIRDTAAEFKEMSGSYDKTAPLGTPGIKDQRDNRDPEEVGREYLNRKFKVSADGSLVLPVDAQDRSIYRTHSQNDKCSGLSWDGKPCACGCLPPK